MKKSLLLVKLLLKRVIKNSTEKSKQFFHTLLGNLQTENLDLWSIL